MFPWAGALEPALPRKKKYPDSAYRSHQVLKNLDYPGCPPTVDGIDPADRPAAGDFRARSEERTWGKLLTGPRSRSADPSLGRRRPQQLNECGGGGAHHGGVAAGKTTEYRSQFAWPPASAVLLASEARKSLSMGTIAHPVTHHLDGTDGATSGQNEDEDTPKSIRKNKVTEYKAKFRPFSSYLYVDGNWRNSTSHSNATTAAGETVDSSDESHAWYAEVVERLKKADEYKSRSHGSPGGVTRGDQTVSSQERRAELWNQVRERSNLVALTLATSTSRPTTAREDKTPERPGTAKHRTPVASTHKKDIRTVSAERKKSPATEHKAKTPVETKTPTPRPAPSRTSRLEDKTTGSSQHRGASAGPSAGSTTKSSSTPTPVIRPRPRATPAPSNTDTSTAVTNGGEDGKIWLKPASTAPSSMAPSTAEDEPVEDKKKEDKKQERPNSFPTQVNGAAAEAVMNGGQDYPSENSQKGPSPLPEPHVGPVPLTTVRSPEEVTGVKSPDPETWTVPLETNRGLEWMDGHTPEMARVKSPPLTGPLKHVVSNQPTGNNDLPPIPDTVPSKIAAEENVVGGPKVENMVSSADVLDRARSRLDQFWSKSK